MTEHATLLAAASFAARRHCNQRRKGSGAAPYINHPLEVAEVLAREGNVTDIALLAAALLHDTIEDTATTHEELVVAFGEDVAGLVEEVTDAKSLPKAERKHRQIKHAATASPRARQLKLADKICNVRDLGVDPPPSWTRQRCLDYIAWARQVVAGLRGANAALEALFDHVADDAVARLERNG